MVNFYKNMLSDYFLKKNCLILVAEVSLKKQKCGFAALKLLFSYYK